MTEIDTDTVHRIGLTAERAQSLLDEVLRIPEATRQGTSGEDLVERATLLAHGLTALHTYLRRERDRKYGDPRSIALLNALDEAGYTPRSYVRRGGYGRSPCVSVSLDNLGELFTLGRDIAGCDAPNPDVESLGLGVVVYWPGTVWPANRPLPRDPPTEDDVCGGTQ